MKLPVKIHPDRIRDSIVQVFFTSKIPFEPSIGYFYSILIEKGFRYSNQPFPFPQNNLMQANELLVNLGAQYFFFNDEVKIQFQNNKSVVFNCTNSYIGWAKYIKIISDTLASFQQANIIENYIRIGIRYISEFPDTDILEKINFKFDLKCCGNPLDTGLFRMEWTEQPYSIKLNLVSKAQILPLAVPNAETSKFISLIDVDIIQQGFQISSTSEFIDIVNKTHQKQKIVFFTLLNEDFLTTLNPVYE